MGKEKCSDGSSMILGVHDEESPRVPSLTSRVKRCRIKQREKVEQAMNAGAVGV